MITDVGSLGTRKSHYLEPRSVIRSCNKIHFILITDISDLKPNTISFMILRLLFDIENQILGASIRDFPDQDHKLSFAEPLFEKSPTRPHQISLNKTFQFYASTTSSFNVQAREMNK
jgi:hypothetical protein